MSSFNFNISLSILNHLGRQLYRNFITVVGEVISNAWDADANNVWINIDRENKKMMVLDDGIGMTAEDFQNKFLKIGYSKRNNNNFKSNLGRPFIGRKGIGKLAMLSCADSITIATKTQSTCVIGGVINNHGLDEAINDDLEIHDYLLEPLKSNITRALDVVTSGTYIVFDGIKNDIFNTIDYIKKLIAMDFKFSLLDPKFNIFVNGERITQELLKDLSNKTQFIWAINGFKDDSFLNENVKNIINIESTLPIKGFIATVTKPQFLKIRGTDNKISLDIFVNGRLRERDILKHIPTARIVENYTYGSLYCDYLDQGDNNDLFTSSREGIIADDPRFQILLKEIQRIYNKIIEEWDELRRQIHFDGDADNKKISPKKRKAEELYNATINDMNIPQNMLKHDKLMYKWINELSEDAQFNVPAYTECFIAENLLRKFINYKQLELSSAAIHEANQWRNRENDSKGRANCSFNIRTYDTNEYYLDMSNLANFIDKNNDVTASLSRSAKQYKPVRDAVGHTSLLTQNAKDYLNIVFENIKARLIELLSKTE